MKERWWRAGHHDNQAAAKFELLLREDNLKEIYWTDLDYQGGHTFYNFLFTTHLRRESLKPSYSCSLKCFIARTIKTKEGNKPWGSDHQRYFFV